MGAWVKLHMCLNLRVLKQPPLDAQSRVRRRCCGGAEAVETLKYLLCLGLPGASQANPSCLGPPNCRGRNWPSLWGMSQPNRLAVLVCSSAQEQ